jgi:membrane-associated HD superfamily phosphohydrolase
MENKMYWLLLVPLLFCLVSIFLSQEKLKSYRNMIITIVLLLGVLILGLSLFLDPRVEKTEQLVLRSLSLFFMLVVAVLVVVSSFQRNIYMEMLNMMLVLLSFILFLLWVSIQNDQLRTIGSIVLTVLFMFFLFQYMKSLSSSSFSSKKQQQQIFMIGSQWQLKPLSS